MYQQRLYQCYYCKEFGHYKSACIKLKNKLVKEPNNPGYNFGHQAKITLIEDNSKPAKIDCKITDSTWNIDSCCSSRMTNHGNWISSYSSFEKPVSVRLGDDHIVFAIGSGKISTTFGILRDVLYVPATTSINRVAQNANSEHFQIRHRLETTNE